VAWLRARCRRDAGATLRKAAGDSGRAYGPHLSARATLLLLAMEAVAAGFVFGDLLGYF